ncbi:MAG: prepilin-type N-terminal cleavage/methylation domain-containing protein, partial [Verrucomicrobiaceae bacterium]
MLRHPFTPPRCSLVRIRPRSRTADAFTLVELVVVLVILAAVAALVINNVDRTTDDAARITATATLHTLRDAITGTAAAPGYLSDMKYVPGFPIVDIRTHDLLSDSRYTTFSPFNPITKRGWRGPYLRNAQGVANINPMRNGRFPKSDDRRFDGDATFGQRRFFFPGETTSPYGDTGDLTVADPWGNPIVIQVPPKTDSNGVVDDAMRLRYSRLVSAGADGILTTPLEDRFAGSKLERGDDLVLFLNRED